MATNPLPKQCIGVLDSKQTGTTRIAKALRQTFSDVSPKVRVIGYRSADDARRQIREAKDCELCGVVIDWVGTQPKQNCVAKIAKRMFPRAPVVLYSSRFEDPDNLADLVSLQFDEELIDRVVPKRVPVEELAEKMRDYYQSYSSDALLHSIRQIASDSKSSFPSVMLPDGTKLTLRELYEDLIRKTGRSRSVQTTLEEALISSLIARAAAADNLHAEMQSDNLELMDNSARQVESSAPTPLSVNQARRREALIDKEIQGTLTARELKELAGLQNRAASYRDCVYPLPIEAARALHKKLMKSASKEQPRRAR